MICENDVSTFFTWTDTSKLYDELFIKLIIFMKKTCGQGARKSAAKTALFRAPLALTVSIDLSASGGEQGEVRVGPQGEQAAPGRLRCEYEIRIQMVGGALP